MYTYIVLIRGINVGGRNLIPMKELTMRLEEQGLSHVKSQGQSGNLVVQSGFSSAAQLSKLIGEIIYSAKGFTANVVSLKHKDFLSILKSNPFGIADSEPKTVHVYFAIEKKLSASKQEFEHLLSNGEDLHITEKAAFLFAPNGIGRSKLAAKLETLLGVNTTARNWQSLNKTLKLIDKL